LHLSIIRAIMIKTTIECCIKHGSILYRSDALPYSRAFFISLPIAATKNSCVEGILYEAI
jgi:hypothetical protein